MGQRYPGRGTDYLSNFNVMGRGMAECDDVFLPVGMNELFFQKFNEIIPLSKEEQEAIESYLSPKKLRKKQYLLQEGDVCKSIAFVEKGALRCFFTDEKGIDHVIQFAIEGWLISDLYSFLTGEPSTYHIEALEHCELLLISKQSHDEMLNRLPKYERYIRLQVTDAYLALQKRITSIISLSLEERYTYFSELYPEIIQRVPQHMIASYMGLTPETLSRVRRRISTNK